MALVGGIAELRGLITIPRDPLYGHLTDLIAALEEASDSKTFHDKTVVFNNKTTGKRKVLVRKKRNKFTQFDNSNRLVDPSSNVSPGIAGSDSSPDEPGKKHSCCASNFVIDLTDSDNEVESKTQRTWSGTIWLKPDLSHLSQRGFVPVESDSFTETLTPARHCRRKRLIKRMAVDQCEDSPIVNGATNFRRHSASMDMEVSNSACSSPRFPTNKRRFRKTGSCHSESSSMECCNTSMSSSESDGNNSDDPGRQGDDEQSDWCFEFAKSTCASQQEECMGIPNVRKMLLRKGQKDNVVEQTISAGSTVESSDTDISQSSCCFKNYVKNCGKRLLHKSGPSMPSALNKRLVNFLRDNSEWELHLGTLTKRERKEIIRLASFYHLSVQCKTSKGVGTYSILKTKYSSVWS